MNDRDWPLTEKDFPAANPYAATAYSSAVAAGDFGSLGSAEEVRKRFLSHEASVRSIGTLYLLGVAILVFSAVVTIISLILRPTNGPNADGGTASIVAPAISIVFVLAIAGLQYWLGTGLRALHPPARTVAIIFSAIGLLGFPIGTLISAYFLYLLLSKKGEFVFSPEYAQVRAATPHIRYKTSVWLLVGIAFLVLVVIVGILAAVLSA